MSYRINGAVLRDAAYKDFSLYRNHDVHADIVTVTSHWITKMPLSEKRRIFADFPFNFSPTPVGDMTEEEFTFEYENNSEFLAEVAKQAICDGVL